MKGKKRAPKEAIFMLMINPELHGTYTGVLFVLGLVLLGLEMQRET